MSDAAAATKRKLRPARKQVKPGDIDTSEKVQPGKEYSEFRRARCHLSSTNFADIWYNKWAGGDKEDALARYVYHN